MPLPLLPLSSRRAGCPATSRSALGLTAPRALALGAGGTLLLALALSLGAPSARADESVLTDPPATAGVEAVAPEAEAAPAGQTSADDEDVADPVDAEDSAAAAEGAVAAEDEGEIADETAPLPEIPAAAEPGDLEEAVPAARPVDREEAVPAEDAVTPEELAGPEEPIEAEIKTAVEPEPEPEALSAFAAPAPALQRAAAAPQAGFTDVPVGMMFSSDILWLQSTGVAQGWPDGTYRPYESIARDAFVAMLFRLQAPADYEAPAASRFVDVDVTNQFYREISWAAGAGVTTGWADGTFRPLAPIQRDAALAMLYRVYGGTTAAPVPARSPFLDIDPGTEHYTAMAWGYANGITTGWGDGTFRPTTRIARDATAAMLHRVVGPRPSASAPLYAGPTGAYAAQQSARTGAPSGLAYRYGSGLRQDTAGGAIFFNPATSGAYFMSGFELHWYDQTGGAQSHGLPITERVGHSSGVLQEFDRAGVYTVDGWTFAVEGEFFARYRAAGGIGGRLGAPSGFAVTGISGISYQNFKGGVLTTPDYLDSPPPTTPSGATPLRYPTLQQGSRSDAVYAVQVKLGIAADGSFGPGTRSAVIAFQAAQGLPQTGIVDARTWARIISVPDDRFDGSNGRLHPNDLVVVAPGWTLARSAAEPYRAMADALQRETGRAFIINDAYRPIDRQIQMLLAFGRPQASYPGTSNHGSAETGALDFELAAGDPTHRWLLANAARFGFTQTAWQRANEPWHWQRG